MKRLLAALLLVASSVHAETVSLTLRLDTAPLSKKESVLDFKRMTPETKPQTETVHVTLAPAFIIAELPTGTAIFDFEKHLAYDMPKDEGATVSSLFATVGSRDREMDNRQYLAAMLERAGGTASIPLAISESNLSMFADPPAKGVEREAKGNTVRFRWRKATLGQYSTETLPASAAEKKAFAQFIRYGLGAHPMMLADLENAAGIPKQLKLVDHLGGRTQQITVEKLERVEDAPYSVPANAKPALASHELWGPILERASALTADDVKTQAKELSTAGDTAFAAAKPVDAFLLYLEAYLMTGEPSQGLQTNGPALRADETVARIQKAIAPHNADEAKAALTLLAEVRKTHPERAEVIRIFEANINTNLGETEAAHEHFHAVLTARPAIAGVWHDLGGMFLNAYSADEAWNCWDTMRRLAPQHGMAKEIHDREAKLMQLYPEYF